jgi:hypothetical protein
VRRLNLPVKKIIGLYAAGKSVAEIASLLGVKLDPVFARLREAGVKMRKGGDGFRAAHAARKKWDAVWAGTRLEYRTWSNMLGRCYNPNNNRFYRYGARGITVCNRWNPAKRGCFGNFLCDMGPKPAPNYSIERSNNNLGYSKRNCYWLPKSEQSAHREPFRQPLRREDVDTGQILSLYIKHGLSSPEIARCVHLSIPTIFRRLQMAGFSAFPVGTNQFSRIQTGAKKLTSVGSKSTQKRKTA